MPLAQHRSITFSMTRRVGGDSVSGIGKVWVKYIDIDSSSGGRGFGVVVAKALIALIELVVAAIAVAELIWCDVDSFSAVTIAEISVLEVVVKVMWCCERWRGGSNISSGDIGGTNSSGDAGW